MHRTIGLKRSVFTEEAPDERILVRTAHPRRQRTDLFVLRAAGQQPGGVGRSSGTGALCALLLSGGPGGVSVPGHALRYRPGRGLPGSAREVVSIRADQKEPWKLIWVGFTGCRAAEYLGRCGLGKENRAFRCDVPEQLERCVQEMVRCEMLGRGHEFLLLGELYRFLGWIARSFEGQGRRSREAGTEYVERAADYIRSHFQEDLTVSKLALYVGLNRSYLTTVFQNTLHVSPQQFLMRFRMERASQLLLEGTLSVGEVARSCGYPDPLTFSKAFKRTLGVTPSQYQRGQAASGLVQASSVDTGGR